MRIIFHWISLSIDSFWTWISQITKIAKKNKQKNPLNSAKVTTVSFVELKALKLHSKYSAATSFFFFFFFLKFKFVIGVKWLFKCLHFIVHFSLIHQVELELKCLALQLSSTHLSQYIITTNALQDCVHLLILIQSESAEESTPDYFVRYVSLTSTISMYLLISNRWAYSSRSE